MNHSWKRMIQRQGGFYESSPLCKRRVKRWLRRVYPVSYRSLEQRTFIEAASFESLTRSFLSSHKGYLPHTATGWERLSRAVRIAGITAIPLIEGLATMSFFRSACLMFLLIPLAGCFPASDSASRGSTLIYSRGEDANTLDPIHTDIGETVKVIVNIYFPATSLCFRGERLETGANRKTTL